MWIKGYIKELLAAMFAAAFIVFTGMGLVPPEAFVGVATAAITYYFEEKSKESLVREVKDLRAQVKGK